VNVIDSSLWVDYFRPKTPLSVKRQVDILVRAPDIVLCEPILFELLRAVTRAPGKIVEQYFSTIPVLSTPRGLWMDARLLGQRCATAGHLPRSMDLLIAQICLHHQAVLTTFDHGFVCLSKVCSLRLNLLIRSSS